MVNSIIRELQNKTVKEATIHLLEDYNQRPQPPPHAGKDAEQELWFIASGKAKWYSHFGRKTARQFLTMLSIVLP